MPPYPLYIINFLSICIIIGSFCIHILLFVAQLNGLRKELDSLRAKFSTLEQERDQLRLANSQFNTQYQDQSKEVTTTANTLIEPLLE